MGLPLLYATLSGLKQEEYYFSVTRMKEQDCRLAQIFQRRRRLLHAAVHVVLHKTSHPLFPPGQEDGADSENHEGYLCRESMVAINEE